MCVCVCVCVFKDIICCKYQLSIVTFYCEKFCPEYLVDG